MSRVMGHEPHLITGAPERLDRDLVVDHRRHDVASLRLPRFCTDSRMTWSTLRCRQVSTWPGSSWSGASGTVFGALLAGLRRGRVTAGREGDIESSSASALELEPVFAISDLIAPVPCH